MDVFNTRQNSKLMLTKKVNVYLGMFGNILESDKCDEPESLTQNSMRKNSALTFRVEPTKVLM